MDDPQHHAELGQAGEWVREPPLEVRQGHVYRSGFSLLIVLGVGFLTFNSGMAIYRSNGDYESIAFVAFSYVDLVMLFACLSWLGPGARSSTRSKLKACVWTLTTLLAILFSYKVAAVMPLAVAAIVWAMAGATIVGGFWAFFHQP